MVSNIPYIIRVVEPVSEPVSLSEAKLYLRLDESRDEDVLVKQLIVAAREAAEHYLRKSLITQTWKMAFDGYVPSMVDLMRGPVQSITEVKIIDRDGSFTVVDNANYYLSADKQRICFEISILGHMIEITYVAGFGDSSKVPHSIKQGMLMHIAQMYDDRQAVVISSASQSLYNNFRGTSL